ncbi:MAG: hypothetical protein AAGU74_14395 [Bacillota bacterium]
MKRDKKADSAAYATNLLVVKENPDPITNVSNPSEENRMLARERVDENQK